MSGHHPIGRAKTQGESLFHGGRGCLGWEQHFSSLLPRGRKGPSSQNSSKSHQRKLPLSFSQGFTIINCVDGTIWVPVVRTVSRKVKLTFILCFGSSSNTFYLYRATSVVCSSTPCYAHMRLYKRCSYCWDLSVPCTILNDTWDHGRMDDTQNILWIRILCD